MSKHHRPVCTHRDYIVGLARAMLRETPERRAELLDFLTEKEWPGWRREMEAEIARQEAAGVTVADLGPGEVIVVLRAEGTP